MSCVLYSFSFKLTEAFIFQGLKKVKYKKKEVRGMKKVPDVMTIHGYGLRYVLINFIYTNCILLYANMYYVAPVILINPWHDLIVLMKRTTQQYLLTSYLGKKQVLTLKIQTVSMLYQIDNSLSKWKTKKEIK